MTSFINRTFDPDLAGKRVDRPVAFPDSFAVNVVNVGETAGLMLTFYVAGKQHAYFLQEEDVAGMQQIFNQALPMVMAQNKPEGTPT